MATFAITENNVVSYTPYLIRKLVCTGGATSVTAVHGENRSPDMAWARIITETPTVTTVAIKDATATTITLDTLGDAADDIEVYLLWYNLGTGGLNTITTV